MACCETMRSSHRVADYEYIDLLMLKRLDKYRSSLLYLILVHP
jgi:hypothetical protein